MKRLVPIILVFTAGCPVGPGDRSRLPVTNTTIPGTEIRVLLHGPGTKGDYACIVVFKGAWTPRDLGRLETSQTMPARLDDLGDGVFRVRWGNAPSEPYVIIDVKKECIVEDSNKENSKNQPFKRPQFER